MGELMMDIAGNMAGLQQQSLLDKPLLITVISFIVQLLGQSNVNFMLQIKKW